MRKQKGLILIVVGIILGSYSCIDNYFELDRLSTSGIEWNPNLAVPLVNTSIGISDLLDNVDSTEFLKEDSTNLLSVVYETKLFSQTAEDFIDIQDQNYAEAFTRSDFDLAGGFVNDSVVMVKENVPFPFSVYVTQLIDSMIFKSALMDIQVASSFRHTGILEISFPGMVKDGIPYKRIVNINSSVGNYTYQEQFTDFEDYFIDLTNFGIGSNTFFVNYKLTLYNAGGNVSNSALTNINIDFTNIEYKFLFGYFGTFDQDLPEGKFGLGFFDELSDQTLQFENPKFTLIVDNSFGIPMRFGFSEFTAYYSETDTYVQITGDSVPSLSDSENAFYIYEPTYIAGQGISPVTSSKTISGRGSNINDVIAETPNEMTFGMGYILNPPGLPSDQGNYVANNSMLDVSFSIEIPLFFFGEFTGFRDTMEIDLAGALENFDVINLALMRLNVNNGLPTGIGIQVYFHDNPTNPPLDSLFQSANDQLIIAGGVVDSQFRVNQETGKTQKLSDIQLDSDKVERIRDAQYIDLKFLFRTTDVENETPVKFYSDYTIDIEMGIQVSGKVKVQ